MTDENSTPVEPVPGETVEAPTEEGRTATAPPEAWVPQQRSEPVEFELSSIFSNPLFWVVAILILLLIGGGVIWGCTRKSTTPVDTVAGKMEPTPAKPGPAVPNGVQSWTEYKAAADSLDKDKVKGNIMYESLAELHPEQGDIRKAVAAMATLEASGTTFLYTAPKGAKFINTDYKVNGGKLGYRFFEDVTKNNKTTFLTFADGTVAVKAGCANAVRFHKNVPGVKKVSSPPGVKKVSSPPGGKKPPHRRPPTRCTNQNGQYAKHGRQNSRTNVGGTNGYVARNNAETVATQQQSEPKGGTTPTKKGTPGAGSGGSTPGGVGTGDLVANPGAGSNIGGTVSSPN